MHLAMILVLTTGIAGCAPGTKQTNEPEHTPQRLNGTSVVSQIPIGNVVGAQVQRFGSSQWVNIASKDGEHILGIARRYKEWSPDVKGRPAPQTPPPLFHIRFILRTDGEDRQISIEVCGSSHLTIKQEGSESVRVLVADKLGNELLDFLEPLAELFSKVVDGRS